MASISARDQVFAIPELTTAIILQLPIQDILIHAQLVNRSWKAAVDSLSVQQALFLSPRSSNPGLKPEFNPLLVKSFPHWFKPTERKGTGRGKRGWQFKELEWGSSDEKCAAYARKEASWRRMLPVQPPATNLEIRQAEHYQLGSYLTVGQVEFAEGVRMGTIYDWAQKTVARPISKFQMKWHMAPPTLDPELDYSMAADEMESLEEIEKRARGQGPPKVTMHTSYTMQCSVGLGGDVGPKFVSQGFEELDISWGEEISLR
ncbi:hypothetical protein DL95DRAFT_382668 [Leptodontidium sp. 2 PMI_412]|nr:hypothetical protein DL95DRAFT_382668 [Leptodontidium sp. 2 PMI_412]